MKELERDYNKAKADKIVAQFKEVTGYNIHNRTRKTKTMLQRSLLYHILHKQNHMNDQRIEDYQKELGIESNRSSVYSSMKKKDYYYDNFEYFKTVYDTYFDDKKNSVEEIKLRIEATTTNEDKKAIYRLIDDIDDSKLADVRELVELRIKSYSWKVAT